MERDRDEYSGRFNREFELEEFIEAVEELAPVSTSEVADKVGCSRDLAYRRLKELDAEGAVSGKKVGGTYHWFPQGSDHED